MARDGCPFNRLVTCAWRLRTWTAFPHAICTKQFPTMTAVCDQQNTSRAPWQGACTPFCPVLRPNPQPRLTATTRAAVARRRQATTCARRPPVSRSQHGAARQELLAKPSCQALAWAAARSGQPCAAGAAACYCCRNRRRRYHEPDLFAGRATARKGLVPEAHYHLVLLCVPPRRLPVAWVAIGERERILQSGRNGDLSWRRI